ncbi:MAG TPA: glycosyltransferase [Kiritimatiellia bacterium]|nr:glycosyltransferase [Kiritimatiellia bacterium]
MLTFPPAWTSLNTALAHDWLTGMRGGEKCLELLCEGFPTAPLHTLLHKPGAVCASIEARPIRTSFLQRVPRIADHYRYWLPFFPLAVRGFPPVDADLLISTSHCVAKALRVKRPGKHLCYCFTPMRYAWTFHDEYFGARSMKQRLARPLLAQLRDWDRRVSDRVDRFIGISRHVCDRIQRFYGREADLVYPPVDTLFYTPGAPGTRRGDFDLVVSALVPYKRVDLAVRAYARSGRPLKVVGIGTETARLRTLAGPNVEFLGWRSNSEIRDLYRQCRLLVFPGEEDFGIVPLEAQACGAPVVAFARGGAVETIVADETGVFFAEQTDDTLLAAVGRGASHAWDETAIRRNAGRFSAQTYIDGLARSIDALLRG